MYKLKDIFIKDDKGWFIANPDNPQQDRKFKGPYADKAEAQMALCFFKTQLQWPSAKELRCFTRQGL